MKSNPVVLLPTIFIVALLFCSGMFADEKLRVLVVTGGHGYEEAPFEAMFKSFEDYDCSFWALKDDSEDFRGHRELVL